MATTTAVAAGGNWNATTTWDTGAVPTAADDVVLAASSGAVTINVSSVCRSLDASAYTHTLTHSASVDLSVGDGSGGSFVLGGGMAYTKGSTSSSRVLFVSTTTGNVVTCATKVLGNIVFNGVGGAWTNTDLLSGNACTFTNGTFTAGAALKFAQYTTATGTKTLNMGSYTWEVTGTGTGWNPSSTGLTLNCQSSTVAFTDTSATARTFASVNKTYNVVSFTVASTAVFSITGAATIGTLNVSNGAKTLRLPASTTTTVTTFNVNGTAGNLVTIDSSIAATKGTISKSSGNVLIDYVTVKDSTASGGAYWNAGADSTLSNTTGWTIETAPKTSLFTGGAWTLKDVQTHTGGSFAQKPVTTIP